MHRSVSVAFLVAATCASAVACSGGKSATPTARVIPITQSVPTATVAASPTLVPSTLALTSSAFADGGAIPAQYTCSGAQTSPPLRWTGVPSGTAAFALIVDDPDAPLPGGFVHWVVFNLSPDTTELPEGATLPPQAVSGNNGAGTKDYRGPCPPAGTPHHYRFHLYALDTPLNLPPGSSKSDVIAATSGHLTGEALLVGIFQR